MYHTIVKVGPLMVQTAVFSVGYQPLTVKLRFCVAVKTYNKTNNSSPLHHPGAMKIDSGKEEIIKLCQGSQLPTLNLASPIEKNWVAITTNLSRI